MSEQPRSGPSVIVVGAGFAGIAAAAALREAGIQDVLVLEAQSRPGGRVQKINLDDGFLETGAQFIHGEKGNLLYDLAKTYNMLMDSSLYQLEKTSDSSAEDYRDNQFCTSRGQRMDQDGISKMLVAANRIIRNYANSFFAEMQLNVTFDNSQRPSLSPTSSAQSSERTIRNSIGNDNDATTQGGNVESSERIGISSKTSPMLSRHQSPDTEPFNSKLSSAPSKQKDTICNKYITDYSGTATTNSTKHETTFEEILRLTKNEILATGNESQDIKLAVLNWIEQWEYTDNAARLEEVSLPAYGKYGYLPGYGLTLSTSGLEDIFSKFLSEFIPSGSLLLNKPVKTVFWMEQQEPFCSEGESNENWDVANSSRRIKNVGVADNVSQTRVDGGCQGRKRSVKVVCEDGKAFQADHVIVTTSMGYLKRHEASMFQPSLPDEFRRAIHAMGFGTVAKIFLIWDSLEEVLSPDVDGVQLLWLRGHPPALPSDRAGRKTQKGGNWYDFLQGFERVQSQPGALLTWLAGEEADIMETLPEDEVKDVLHELLKAFTNNHSMPPPRQMVRSQWYSNPYIMGGYSFIPAGMDPETHDIFSCPLPSDKNPALHLAGEATSSRFYSTVHGAIESGQRAARAIIDHYDTRVL